MQENKLGRQTKENIKRKCNDSQSVKQLLKVTNKHAEMWCGNKASNLMKYALCLRQLNITYTVQLTSRQLVPKVHGHSARRGIGLYQRSVIDLIRVHRAYITRCVYRCNAHSGILVVFVVV